MCNYMHYTGYFIHRTTRSNGLTFSCFSLVVRFMKHPVHKNYKLIDTGLFTRMIQLRYYYQLVFIWVKCIIINVFQVVRSVSYCAALFYYLQLVFVPFLRTIHNSYFNTTRQFHHHSFQTPWRFCDTF